MWVRTGAGTRKLTLRRDCVENGLTATRPSPGCQALVRAAWPVVSSLDIRGPAWFELVKGCSATPGRDRPSPQGGPRAGAANNACAIDSRATRGCLVTLYGICGTK